MNESINRIVIVGAGQAGTAVAFGLRQSGFNGEVMLIGEESHLPYERPQLSKEMLQPDRIGHKSIKTQADFDDKQIQLILGRRLTNVFAEARAILLDDNSLIQYDRLVIATGVKPRRLPDTFNDPQRVRYLRTIEDATRLRENLAAGEPVAIVGGGVIGLEVAAAARAQNCSVTLVESCSRLMSRSVDETISWYLDRVHRANGVDIRYGVQATELLSNGQLTLSDGSAVSAEVVLAGIGVTPNVEGMEHLGIADAIGIRVDAYGQTSIEGIYATGDIATQPNAIGYGRVETWANAQDHPMHVVRNILGEAVPYEAPVWFWSDQGRINLQVVGNATQGKRVIRGDINADAFSIFFLDEDNCVTGCSSVNSPKDMAVARRWVKQRSGVVPERLADLEVPLRNCAL